LAVQVGAAAPSGSRGLSTGFGALDRITGYGGFPRGRITELVGRATSGRTTVAAQGVAQAEGFSAWVDVPGLVDVDRLARQGIDLGRLYIVRPEHPDDALTVVAQLVSGGHFDLVVLDSLADIADGEPRARLLEPFLRVLVSALAGNPTAAVILTAPEQHSPALASAAALRIAFSPTGVIRLGGAFRGWRSQATVLKAPGHQNEEVGLEVWIN
jgi:hypothetical protein